MKEDERRVCVQSDWKVLLRFYILLAPFFVSNSFGLLCVHREYCIVDLFSHISLMLVCTFENKQTNKQK